MPRGLWEVADQRLRDVLSAERADQILAAVVETLGRLDAPYYRPDHFRRYASAMRDLLTALDPDADPDVRALAAKSMFELHSADALDAEIAKSGLRKKARERMSAAVRSVSSAGR